MVSFTKALQSLPQRPKKKKWWLGSREKTLPEAQVSQELFPIKKRIQRPPIREYQPRTKAQTPEQKAQLRTQKKALTRKFKCNRPIYVHVPAPKEEELEEKEQPGVCMRVQMRKRLLWVTVALHKVPEQFIHVDCTPTTFNLDTKGWTKKLEIHQEYIGRVRVEPAQAKAEIRQGVLRVALPITHIPRDLEMKQKKVIAAVRKARTIRFVQGRNGELLGVRETPSKGKSGKGKWISTSGADKGSTAQAVVEPVVDSLVKPSTATTSRKRKVFLGDGDKALKIVDKVAAEHEQMIAEKQQQMSKIARFIQARQEEMAQKYNRAKTARDTSYSELRDAKKKELDELDALSGVPVPLAAGQEASNKPRRRVSFAATAEVAVYHGGDTESGPSSKKKKRKENITLEYE